MRNLKKILALVLALVMTFSVMATANAFTDDSQIDATYDEAVTVLSNLKVFQGYKEDGSFRPQGNITRAEVAAIIYRIVTGDVNDTQVGIYADYNKFSDVKSTSWYAGYVNFCANAEYIKGYGNGKFGPDDKVTGYQALAMILRAVGYDKNGEFTGANWQVQTAAVGKKLSVTDNVSAGTLGGTATREVVAEILFRAIQVPQVEYTVAFGYQNKNYAIFGNDNASLGAETFGLAKVSGVIEQVGRKAGTTQFATATKLDTVAGTNTPWTDIGYNAYVYTVSTSGAKTRTAVSDVVVTGKSLLTSTDGTSYTNLLKKVSVDTVDGYDVYYNGVKVATGLKNTATNNGVFETNALNAIDKRGVKVDFVDNDNQGKAEAVIVTEYTPAVITGITNTTTTGYNAVAKDTVYFTTSTTTSTTSAVKAENVVSASELAVDDVVTYVDYKGLDTVASRYTNVSAYAADTFKLINNYNYNTTKELSYLIGDATLYVSAIGFNGAANALVKDNLGKTIGYYVDEYGYIIDSFVVTAASQYLFGVTNAHYNGNTKQAEGYVVLTDGTVPCVNIAKVNNETLTIENNDITKNMYTYTIGSDGKYTLKTAGKKINSIAYTTGKAPMTLNSKSFYVDNKTVVIDVTDVLKGTATEATVYTGHTGDSKIPSMEAASGWYIATANGYVSLMFVYDTSVTTKDAFYLYDADPYTTTYTSAGVKYVYNVVRDGDIANGAQVTLNAAQHAFVKAHGVGSYKIAGDGSMSYESFVELYAPLSWGYNTIVNQANEYGVSAGAYTFTDETTFTVFDVVNKTAANYTLNVGKNYLFNSTSVTYGFIDATKGVAEHVYVVVGPVANADTTGVATTTEKDGLTGVVTYYYVADKYVTGVVRTDIKTYTVKIDNAVWKTVEEGTTVILPDGEIGTGMALANGKVDEYIPYGGELTVKGDVELKTGYVKFVIDGKAPIAVAVAANEYALTAAQVDGKFYQATYKGTTETQAAGHKHGTDCDHTIVSGFYQVKINDLEKTTKVTAGKLYNANGTEVTTITAGTYYAQAGTVIARYADNTSTPDETYTVTNDNLVIKTQTVTMSEIEGAEA